LKEAEQANRASQEASIHISMGADIDDGLYLISQAARVILSYDNSAKQLTSLDLGADTALDANSVRGSVWYIHKMTNHNSHEIHLAALDKSLRATAGGADLASGDSDTDARYRWNFTKDTAGGWDITNVHDNSQQLTSVAGPIIVGRTLIPSTFAGPWNLTRLDEGKQNQDGGEDSRSNEDNPDDDKNSVDSEGNSSDESIKNIIKTLRGYAQSNPGMQLSEFCPKVANAIERYYSDGEVVPVLSPS